MGILRFVASERAQQGSPVPPGRTVFEGDRLVSLHVSFAELEGLGGWCVPTPPAWLRVSSLPRNDHVSVRQALVSCVAHGVRRLDLSGNDVDASVWALAQAPEIAGLEALAIAGAGLGPEGISTLLVSPHATALAGLDVRRNAHFDAGRAVAEASKGRRLEWDRGADALVATRPRVAPAAPKVLRSLDLGLCRLGDDGASQLAGATMTLTTLGLRGSRLTEVGLARLMSAPLTRGLRRLDLSHNPNIASVAEELATSPNAATLEELDLTGCRATEEGLAMLLGELPRVLVHVDPALAAALAAHGARVRRGPRIGSWLD